MRLMRKTIISLMCLALVGQSSSAMAISLMQAYQAALKNDPQHRAAIADNQFGKQYENIGRSGLLPSVQYSYATSKNKGESITPGLFNTFKESDLDYRSISKGFTLRQPLFNLDAYARFNQGVAQTKLSDAQFDARSQDLMVRVLTAYMDAKYAEDQLSLYQANQSALAEQKKVNDRLFEKGEGTRTDMLETQAKLDVAEALVLEAKDQALNTKNILSGIVGEDVKQLDSLRDVFNTGTLIQANFDSLVATTESTNPELAAAKLAIEVAEQEVAKSKAGHAPKLDINASYNMGKSETVTTVQQNNNIRSLGIQLVIPIYSGGYATAVMRQAAAQKEKAKADYDSTYNKVMNELRKQFNAVNSNLHKVEAMQKAVKSSQLLVEATSQSVKGGIRINLDLLNAQQQLVTSKRDLAQARYTYLVSFIKLKVVTGVADFGDLQVVAGFFESK